MGVLMEEAVAEPCAISGVVKWYDPSRGYGFIVPDDEGQDVLLHASCVRNFGTSSVREADRVVVDAVETERGYQAVRLVSVEPSMEAPAPAPQVDPADAVRPSDIAAAAAPHGALFPARVKWFDKHKGFGFVNVYGDPQDVFVHMETVRDGGMPTLQPGEAVLVRTTKGPRGVMVSQISEWESVNLVDSAADGKVSRLKTTEST